MPKLSEAGKKALDELLAQTEAQGRLPGFALSVSNLEEQIYSKAHGRQAHHDPNSPEVNVDESVFWVCSMTKLLVAIAALQLIEKGKLSLSTPVSTFFPVFKDAVVLENAFTDPNPKHTKATKEVTIEHLFTHTSGIPYGIPRGVEVKREHMHILPPPYTSEYPEGEEKYDKFWELVKGDFPGIPLVFEPGSAFCYGFSSDVLGFVVEKVTGLSLEEYSQQNIFKPIGVKNTYHLTQELKDKLVGLHYRNEDGSIEGWKDRSKVIQRFPQPVNMNFGGIGSYSTVPDYLAILRHLLQIEAGRELPNAILTRETVKSLLTPRLTQVTGGPLGKATIAQIIAMMESSKLVMDVDWGLGVAVNEKDWDKEGGLKGRRKGSGFWSGWAGTWYFMDPTTGIALVFASQIAPPMDPVTGEITEKAEEIVYANLVD